jgi:hypothetical protein
MSDLAGGGPIRRFSAFHGLIGINNLNTMHTNINIFLVFSMALRFLTNQCIQKDVEGYIVMSYIRILIM